MPECGKPKRQRGWCWSHFYRWRRYGDPNHVGFARKTCSVDGCDRAFRVGGMCDMHYRRAKAHGDPNVRMTMPRGACTEQGCTAKAFGRGLCQRHHYATWVERGGRTKKAAAMSRRRANMAGAAISDRTLGWASLWEAGTRRCYICGCDCNPDDYRLLLNRAGRQQKICGPAYPTLDHIVPLSKGGAHASTNTALACMACNRKKCARAAREAKHHHERQAAQSAS